MVQEVQRVGVGLRVAHRRVRVGPDRPLLIRVSSERYTSRGFVGSAVSKPNVPSLPVTQPMPERSTKMSCVKPGVASASAERLTAGIGTVVT